MERHLEAVVYDSVLNRMSNLKRENGLLSFSAKIKIGGEDG
jgi:hypothetical protein